MEIAKLKAQGTFAGVFAGLAFLFATVLLFVPFGEYGSVLSPATYDGRFSIDAIFSFSDREGDELGARTFWIVVLYILFVSALVFAVNRFRNANTLMGDSPVLVSDLTAAYQSKSASGNVRPCPFCAESIQVAAVYCKHCKRDLESV